MKTIFNTLVLIIFCQITLFGQNTDYSITDGGIEIERYENNDSPSKYTDDNEIYKGKDIRTFKFQYFDKNGKELFFDKTRYGSKWNFTETTNDSIIKYIRLTVESDNSAFKEMPEYDQSIITYEYLNPIYHSPCSSMEFTGLVENKKNIWMHPPRSYLFRILEINPFPYIKLPVENGKEWSWKLEIGSGWGDERWKTWEGTIENIYKYKITDTDSELNTDLGILKCTKIESEASSRLGKTYLTAYYNDLYGFVKLEYINIDNSKIILELIKKTKFVNASTFSEEDFFENKKIK